MAKIGIEILYKNYIKMMNGQTFASSLLVSLMIGFGGMSMLIRETKIIREKHLMNVFSQIILALIFSGSFVRSFTWTLYAWQGIPLD